MLATSLLLFIFAWRVVPASALPVNDMPCGEKCGSGIPTYVQNSDDDGHLLLSDGQFTNQPLQISPLQLSVLSAFGNGSQAIQELLVSGKNPEQQQDGSDKASSVIWKDCGKDEAKWLTSEPKLDGPGTRGWGEAWDPSNPLQPKPAYPEWEKPPSYPKGFNPSTPTLDPFDAFPPKMRVAPNNEICDLTGKIPCSICHTEVKKMRMWCQRKQRNMDRIETFCDSTADEYVSPFTTPQCRFISKKLEIMACPNPCEMLRSRKLMDDTQNYVCQHQEIQCVGEPVEVIEPPPSPTPAPCPLECSNCNMLGRLLLQFCQTDGDPTKNLTSTFCGEYFKASEVGQEIADQCLCMASKIMNTYPPPDHVCRHLTCPADIAAMSLCKKLGASGCPS